MSLAPATAAQDLLFREGPHHEHRHRRAGDEEQMQAIYDLIKYGPTSMDRSPLELPQLFPHFPQAKDASFGERAVREDSAALNAALQAT